MWLSVTCQAASHRQKERQADGTYTHTSRGPTKEIRQLKGHGSLGFSQEAGQAKENSGHGEEER